jgi:hypothetical protein
MGYTNTNVCISQGQADKIKNAIDNNEPVTIQFSIEDLKEENPCHTLALTKTQIDKLADALEQNKGVRITMSKTQLQYNKSIKGGFIGSLLAGLTSAALPPIVSFIMDKISGKGIFMKKGGNLIKLKQMGDGLYLRPYTASRVGDIAGDGLYIKSDAPGGASTGFELIKDGSIKDIPLLNIL